MAMLKTNSPVPTTATIVLVSFDIVGFSSLGSLVGRSMSSDMVV